jgi:hypothetical protein
VQCATTFLRLRSALRYRYVHLLKTVPQFRSLMINKLLRSTQVTRPPSLSCTKMTLCYRPLAPRW